MENVYIWRWQVLSCQYEHNFSNSVNFDDVTAECNHGYQKLFSWCNPALFSSWGHIFPTHCIETINHKEIFSFWRNQCRQNKTLLTINLLEYPIPTATAVTATRHKNRHMALHVAAAWYHRSNGVKTTGKNPLTLSGPDVPAWAAEGRKGRSQEARRASS